MEDMNVVKLPFACHSMKPAFEAEAGRMDVELKVKIRSTESNGGILFLFFGKSEEFGTVNIGKPKES